MIWVFKAVQKKRTSYHWELRIELLPQQNTRVWWHEVQNRELGHRVWFSINSTFAAMKEKDIHASEIEVLMVVYRAIKCLLLLLCCYLSGYGVRLFGFSERLRQWKNRMFMRQRLRCWWLYIEPLPFFSCCFIAVCQAMESDECAHGHRLRRGMMHRTLTTTKHQSVMSWGTPPRTDRSGLILRNRFEQRNAEAILEIQSDCCSRVKIFVSNIRSAPSRTKECSLRKSGLLPSKYGLLLRLCDHGMSLRTSRCMILETCADLR